MGDYTGVAERLGQRIRASREERGYTQQDLAELLGMERSTIASWEAGRRMPDYPKILRLEEVLGPLQEGSAAAAPRTQAVRQRQIRGLLRAEGATDEDVRLIFQLLRARRQARKATE